MDVGAGEEALAHRAGGGVGVAEEVGAGLVQPRFEGGGVEAGADGGVEEDLALLLPIKRIFAIRFATCS